jgi:6-pyruvoyltetrahydropterin/6-carboxytetrahydropterin synthase
MYLSTKTFGHELGLSCAFRQWRANSHCNKIHGYALSFKFTFACEVLDDRNWCVNFGGLKYIKEELQRQFDHKLVVAKDDPDLPLLMTLNTMAVADVVVQDAVGCEAFAKQAFTIAENWLYDSGAAPRVWIISCEVAEHGANSAIYTGENE